MPTPFEPFINGRMTWFNPRPYNYTDPTTGIDWTDTGAKTLGEGAHASGLPISTPGFATSNRQTLGHWHEVTLPDGRKYVTQQTDIGPPGVVDLNAALASQAYPGGPQTVPGGNVTARYLGPNLPEGMTAGAQDEEPSGSPAGNPVQAQDLPDQSAYASGPPQGRKMPTSLMDMFQPQNAAGGPSSFADALASRSNSLIGLGLGLLQPSRPLQGENAYTNAMQGYMGGASLDAKTATEAAKLKQQALQNARQAQQDAFMRQMAEKQFARGGETDFQKMTADITKYGQPAEQFYAAKLGNVPQIASIDDPDNPGDKISVIFNPRAPAGQMFSRIPIGSRTAGADPFANATNPYAPGATAQAAPSGGGPGTVGYGTGGMGPGGFGGSGASTQPSIPFTSAGTAQSGQGPVEAKTMREARAKAVISNEEEAVKSAKAAAEFKPALDEMTAAYEALAKAGGVGPIQGSSIGRAAQAVTGYGGANESLRQRYDTAKGKVQALITAAQNKGEGAVSNYERQMFGAQFPQLNALDAKTQLPFLRQLQSATEQSIAAGRGTSLGPSPGTFTRPPIEQPQQTTKAPTASAPRPGFVKGGYVFKGGDPSDQKNWAPVR